MENFPVCLEVKYVSVVADLKYVFPGNQGSRKVQFAPPHSGYTEIGKYRKEYQFFHPWLIDYSCRLKVAVPLARLQVRLVGLQALLLSGWDSTTVGEKIRALANQEEDESTGDPTSQVGISLNLTQTLVVAQKKV